MSAVPGPGRYPEAGWRIDLPEATFDERNTAPFCVSWFKKGQCPEGKERS